jgi:hypothetical protein
VPRLRSGDRRNQLNTPLAQILEMFEAARWNGECARVAILGPRRCGKTILLREASEAIRSAGGRALLQLRLDLAAERFNGFDEPAKQLARTFRNNEKLRKAPYRSAIEALSAEITLATLIESILRTYGGQELLIEIDHLEAAPLFFARALAEQLHPLLDVGLREDSTAANRLGLLVCGSLSLHNLLDDRKSGFIHCKRLSLPSTDPTVRKTSAIRMLSQRWEKHRTQAAEALATWTGGEAAFAEELCDELIRSSKSPTKSNIEILAKQLAMPETPLQVLHDLAMEVLRNPNLRDRVLTALEHRSTGRAAPIATLLGAAGDISQMELSGVFVISNGRYEFRNEMVAHFLDRLMNEGHRLGLWTQADAISQRATSINDALRLPLHLVHCARMVARDRDVWSVLPKLASLWNLMTIYGQAEIAFFMNLGGKWYRFDETHQTIVPVTADSEASDLSFAAALGAMDIATRGANRLGGNDSIAYFDADDSCLTVGIPLVCACATGAVVTTIRRSGAGTAWSEPLLRNWIWFVRNEIGPALNTLASAELLYEQVFKRTVGQADSRIRDESLFRATAIESQLMVTAIRCLKSLMLVREALQRLDKHFGTWAQPILKGVDILEIAGKQEFNEMLDIMLKEDCPTISRRIADLKNSLEDGNQQHPNIMALAANALPTIAEVLRRADAIKTARNDMRLAQLKEDVTNLKQELAKASGQVEWTPDEICAGIVDLANRTANRFKMPPAGE